MARMTALKGVFVLCPNWFASGSKDLGPLAENMRLGSMALESPMTSIECSRLRPIGCDRCRNAQTFTMIEVGGHGMKLRVWRVRVSNGTTGPWIYQLTRRKLNKDMNHLVRKAPLNLR